MAVIPGDDTRKAQPYRLRPGNRSRIRTQLLHTCP